MKPFDMALTDPGRLRWLHDLLNNPDATDILINGACSAYADRGQGLERVSPSTEAQATEWSEEEVRGWALEQISLVGKTWDAKHPFLDASLPSGHRIHIAFPPLSRTGTLISLRRIAQPPTMERGNSMAAAAQAARQRWESSPLFDRVATLVRQGDSILISGATGSGKTTLASDLLTQVPHDERILALEDTPELNPLHPHFISLLSRPPNADGFGEITLRTLLKQALRMRPDRIILGECRGAEVLELLQALNTGHRGAMATLHANSPRDALRRVELLCLLGGGGVIPLTALRELLSHGVQWVVQLRRHQNRREIAELWRIEGREGDTILMRPMVDS